MTREHTVNKRVEACIHNFFLFTTRGSIAGFYTSKIKFYTFKNEKENVELKSGKTRKEEKHDGCERDCTIRWYGANEYFLYSANFLIVCRQSAFCHLIYCCEAKCEGNMNVCVAKRKSEEEKNFTLLIIP